MGSDRTYLLSKQLYPTPNQKGLGQQSVGRHHAVGWLCCWFQFDGFSTSGVVSGLKKWKKRGNQKKKTFPPIICLASVKQHLNIHVNDQIRHNLSLLCWHTIYGLFVCLFFLLPSSAFSCVVHSYSLGDNSKPRLEWMKRGVSVELSFEFPPPSPLPGKKKKTPGSIVDWVHAANPHWLSRISFPNCSHHLFWLRLVPWAQILGP